MLTIEWPYLLAMAVLPWLFALFGQKQAPKAQATTALKLQGSHTLLTSAVMEDKPKWQSWLLLLAWGLAVIACSRPQWLGDPVPLERQGRDLMVAADLSGSMQVQDMEFKGQMVDRFSMMQYLLGQFIERREGDRIGLILFADAAYLQAPLTFDRPTVKRYLDESALGLVGQQTAIGDAIALGVKRFAELDNPDKVLILMTDGTNNAGHFKVAEATKLAKQAGVKIYTIGIGAESIQQSGWLGMRTREVNPSKDLNESALKEIAAQTGGHYFRARSGEEMAQIYSRLDQLEPVARDAKMSRPRTELYPWPLAGALGLTLLVLMMARGGRRG